MLRPPRRRGRRPSGVARAPARAAARVTALAVLCAAVSACLQLPAADPASAAIGTSVGAETQAAAQVATAGGYRTGVAVLDLATGAYSGAGDDSRPFASESVAKAFIATQLLLSGQMTGDVEPIAYRMITASDDAA
ncbi:MAG: hypothetical protein JWO98_1038, partial [Frankiales bacterium]|nr:hypothetical protein [Frankiales bacterium]